MHSTKTTPVSEKELEKIIKQVLSENSKAIEDYRKGKVAVLGFLMSIVVRKLSQVDKQLVYAALKKALGGESH